MMFSRAIGKHTLRHARATWTAEAAAPVAQIVRGQHGGKMLLLLQELHFKTRVLLKGIYTEDYVSKKFSSNFDQL